jgi:hypothetical protein
MKNSKFEKVKKNFETNLEALQKELEKKYLLEINVAEEFGGPSIYFHNKALHEMKSNFLELSHLEAIYAMLPAWGMHRMGDAKTKTKVVKFKEFKQQIENKRGELLSLKDKQPHEVSVEELSELLVNLRVTIADSHLVSSSKVLHHIIPNLICPIDRQYSLQFLLHEKSQFFKSQVNYKNEDEQQYAEIFLHGMRDFIKYNEDNLKSMLDKTGDMDKDFNTSLTKIFDNLVMAFVKRQKPQVV